jgi:predicted transcriptional regulator
MWEFFVVFIGRSSTDSISDEQKKDVLEGLAEADRGETVPHSENY